MDGNSTYRQQHPGSGLRYQPYPYENSSIAPANFHTGGDEAIYANQERVHHRVYNDNSVVSSLVNERFKPDQKTSLGRRTRQWQAENFDVPQVHRAELVTLRDDSTTTSSESEPDVNPPSHMLLQSATKPLHHLTKQPKEASSLDASEDHGLSSSKYSSVRKFKPVDAPPPIPPKLPKVGQIGNEKRRSPSPQSSSGSSDKTLEQPSDIDPGYDRLSEFKEEPKKKGFFSSIFKKSNKPNTGGKAKAKKQKGRKKRSRPFSEIYQGSDSESHSDNDESKTMTHSVSQPNMNMIPGYAKIKKPKVPQPGSFGLNSRDTTSSSDDNNEKQHPATFHRLTSMPNQEDLDKMIQMEEQEEKRLREENRKIEQMIAEAPLYQNTEQLRRESSVRSQSKAVMPNPDLGELQSPRVMKELQENNPLPPNDPIYQNAEEARKPIINEVHTLSDLKKMNQHDATSLDTSEEIDVDEAIGAKDVGEVRKDLEQWPTPPPPLREKEEVLVQHGPGIQRQIQYAATTPPAHPIPPKKKNSFFDFKFGRRKASETKRYYEYEEQSPPHHPPTTSDSTRMSSSEDPESSMGPVVDVVSYSWKQPKKKSSKPEPLEDNSSISSKTSSPSSSTSAPSTPRVIQKDAPKAQTELAVEVHATEMKKPESEMGDNQQQKKNEELNTPPNAEEDVPPLLPPKKTIPLYENLGTELPMASSPPSLAPKPKTLLKGASRTSSRSSSPSPPPRPPTSHLSRQDSKKKRSSSFVSEEKKNKNADDKIKKGKESRKKKPSVSSLSSSSSSSISPSPVQKHGDKGRKKSSNKNPSPMFEPIDRAPSRSPSPNWVEKKKRRSLSRSSQSWSRSPSPPPLEHQPKQKRGFLNFFKSPGKKRRNLEPVPISADEEIERHGNSKKPGRKQKPQYSDSESSANEPKFFKFGSDRNPKFSPGNRPLPLPPVERPREEKPGDDDASSRSSSLDSIERVRKKDENDPLGLWKGRTKLPDSPVSKKLGKRPSSGNFQRSISRSPVRSPQRLDQDRRNDLRRNRGTKSSSRSPIRSNQDFDEGYNPDDFNPRRSRSRSRSNSLSRSPSLSRRSRRSSWLGSRSIPPHDDNPRRRSSNRGRRSSSMPRQRRNQGFGGMFGAMPKTQRGQQQHPPPQNYQDRHQGTRPPPREYDPRQSQSLPKRRPQGKKPGIFSMQPRGRPQYRGQGHMTPATSQSELNQPPPREQTPRQQQPQHPRRQSKGLSGMLTPASRRRAMGRQQSSSSNMRAAPQIDRQVSRALSEAPSRDMVSSKTVPNLNQLSYSRSPSPIGKPLRRHLNASRPADLDLNQRRPSGSSTSSPPESPDRHRIPSNSLPRSPPPPSSAGLDLSWPRTGNEDENKPRQMGRRTGHFRKKFPDGHAKPPLPHEVTINNSPSMPSLRAEIERDPRNSMDDIHLVDESIQRNSYKRAKKTPLMETTPTLRARSSSLPKLNNRNKDKGLTSRPNPDYNTRSLERSQSHVGRSSQDPCTVM